MGHGIVLKGIVKYYGRGKNIPHTFGHTDSWGQLLEYAGPYEAYGFKVDTDSLSRPGPKGGRSALLSFYTGEDMYHLIPNPSVSTFSGLFKDLQPSGRWGIAL